jgi:murein DD-endopeptidase MepM/ murein hydrolase activator NlpD
MRFNEFNITESVETDIIKQLQTDLKAAGANLGRFGPKNDGIDGKIGSLTQTAMLKFPEIAAEYKKTLKAALARDEFAANDPRRIKFGQNPNIDNTTRDKARDYVKKIGKKDNDDILPVDGRVSSPFGYRTLGGHSKNHNGTDFAVPVGTPIVAPADGVISRAGNKEGPEGKFIVLDASGVVHKFFHLSKIMVAPGESVDRGQTIGLSGNTGRSTGAHLHWEKHVAGLPVDPMSDMG